MEGEVRVLGPVEAVTTDGRVVRPGPAKERALLALLALHVGRVVPTGALIDGLWGEDPPEAAGNALQVYVSHLRRALGRETIRTVPAGYTLAVEPDRVDADRFERLTGSGRAALAGEEPERAAQLLRAALDLWRGAPLVDCAKAPFAGPESTRLEELRLGALEDRAAADLDCGRAAEVVAELQALVAAHPFRERLRAALMVALYRTGRRAEALDAYAAAQRVLGDELGIEPGPELQRLHRAVLAEDRTLASPGRATTLVTRPPAPPGPLLGRDREFGELCALITRPGVRLVTVLGTGGVGKTRLCVEAAHRLGDRFADGVCYVALAPLADPAHVLPAVGHALGLRATGGEALADRVAAVLRPSQLLLVLDNLEHLLPFAARVAELLAAAPRLAVLVTSRVALRLAGEHRYLLGPLPLPDPARAADPGHVGAAPAAALFLDRARAVRPGLSLTPGNAAAVAGICARLDGLPLAIELAAARAGVLPPEQLLARLDRSLSLLTAGTADAPARHRSLRAALDWSHDLLTPPVRRLFARLGCFRGGFTVEAAEAVGDPNGDLGLPVLDGLDALTDANLLTHDRVDDSGARLGMLETVREFAIEQLDAGGDAPRIRDAHAAYFARLIAAPGSSAPMVPRTMAEGRVLEREQENIRAAIAWAGDTGRCDLYADLAVAAAQRWAVAGLAQEAESWLDRAARQAPTAQRKVDALTFRGVVTRVRGDYAQARTLHEKAVAEAGRLGDPIREAHALGHYAFLLYELGEAQHAVTAAEAAYAKARTSGDLDVQAFALNNLGISHIDTDLARARDLFAEAVETSRAAGNDVQAGRAAISLAEVALAAGDPVEACTRAEKALRHIASAPLAHSRALDLLGAAWLARGDLIRAELILREAVRFAEEAQYSRMAAASPCGSPRWPPPGGSTGGPRCCRPGTKPPPPGWAPRRAEAAATSRADTWPTSRSGCPRTSWPPPAARVSSWT